MLMEIELGDMSFLICFVLVESFNYLPLSCVDSKARSQKKDPFVTMSSSPGSTFGDIKPSKFRVFRIIEVQPLNLSYS